uniref:Uncharacterized protein n=1 Tax=Salix viminalis TaxID=40686 RepID=A0A6N2MCG5_SALVM
MSVVNYLYEKICTSYMVWKYEFKNFLHTKGRKNQPLAVDGGGLLILRFAEEHQFWKALVWSSFPGTCHGNIPRAKPHGKQDNQSPKQVFFSSSHPSNPIPNHPPSSPFQHHTRLPLHYCLPKLFPLTLILAPLLHPPP